MVTFFALESLTLKLEQGVEGANIVKPASMHEDTISQ